MKFRKDHGRGWPGIWHRRHDGSGSSYRRALELKSSRKTSPNHNIEITFLHSYFFNLKSLDLLTPSLVSVLALRTQLTCNLQGLAHCFVLMFARGCGRGRRLGRNYHSLRPSYSSILRLLHVHLALLNLLLIIVSKCFRHSPSNAEMWQRTDTEYIER